MIRLTLLRLFLTLAAIGFLASVAVHLSTFFGFHPGGPVFLLHIGIFVVFIPAILLAGSPTKKQDPESKQKAMDVLWESIPKGFKVAIGLLGAYAIVNFVLFAFYLSGGGTPGEIDGKLVLHSHGEVIRELSPEEFDRQEAYVVRGFSGHWMAFYGVAFAMLFAGVRNAAKLAPRRAYGEADVEAISAAPAIRRTASSPLDEDEPR